MSREEELGGLKVPLLQLRVKLLKPFTLLHRVLDIKEAFLEALSCTLLTSTWWI